MNDVLKKNEVEALRACETVIERGRTAFVEVGRALLDIRDGKLYRASHGTFDDYCTDRWGFDRTYAHRLIDGAKTVQAIVAAAPDLLPMVNKLPERQIREMKADPVGAATEIKERSAKGEEPAAVAKDIAGRVRAEKAVSRDLKNAEKATNEAFRDDNRAQQSDAVKAVQATKEAVIASRKAIPDDELLDENAELEAAVEDLKAEVATLQRQKSELADRLMLYERDGVEATVAHFKEMAHNAKRTAERESAKMKEWKDTAKFWEKEAKKLGYSRDMVIDLKTLEEVRG